MRTTTKQQIFLWSLSALMAMFAVSLSQTLAQAQPPETKPTETKAATKLTGAELYAINCNRCHTERYPTEFTSAQWKTIMMHMRVRANLAAEQADLILKYLQEVRGN